VIATHRGLMKESSKITHHDLTEPDDHPPRSSKVTAANGSVRRPTPLIGPCAYGLWTTSTGVAGSALRGEWIRSTVVTGV
jgi:hypothetical protein